MNTAATAVAVAALHFAGASEELAQRLSMPSEPQFMDPNNNKNTSSSAEGTPADKGGAMRGDKYSLRPRSTKRTLASESPPKANGNSSLATAPSPKTKAAKPKQKPAPLSKYRRKTANARERSRMREINAAFETLRRAVPHVSSTCSSSQAAAAAAANEKLTKITTLRLAMKYISTLSAALSSGSDCSSVADLLSDCSDLDCLLSDGESLALHSDLSDHSLTPADFSVDFADHSLTPVDFSPLSSDFGDSHLSSPFDPFLTDFS